jgi:hypothetical protein
MSTGASRLLRSFLCTHRKFISTMVTWDVLTRMWAGTALMKATSLPLAATRTPTSQSAWVPGGSSAHCRNSGE